MYISFTIPKPYLIGRLSTIVIIFHPIINIHLPDGLLNIPGVLGIILYERIIIRFILINYVEFSIVVHDHYETVLNPEIRIETEPIS